MECNDDVPDLTGATSVRTERADAGEDLKDVQGSGAVVWMTGLSGAGKTTLATRLCQRLSNLGIPVIVLDGDVVRSGLCRDLGFSEKERDENVRRVAEVARLASSQGYVVLCALISPLRSQRRMARQIVGGRFLEVHVACDLRVAMGRDPKGLYKLAKEGHLPMFTGVSAVYEAPLSPDVRIDTDVLSQEACCSIVERAIVTPLGR